MRSKRAFTAALMAILAATGCGGGPSIEQDTIENLTLYSIDGRLQPKPQTPDSDDHFYGYPLLGKVEVKDAKTRNELMTAFNDGVAKGKDLAKCFWPRHVLRVVRNGKTTDHLICFECLQFLTCENGKGSEAKAIDKSPLETFNRVLKQANVPLAPSPFKP